MKDANIKKRTTRVCKDNFNNFLSKTISICCLLIVFAILNLPVKAQSTVTAGVDGFVFIDNQQTPAVGAKVKFTSQNTQVV